MKKILLLLIIIMSALLYLRVSKPTESTQVLSFDTFENPIPELPTPTQTNPNPEILGTLPSGRTIEVYHFGAPQVDVLIIGSIHGSQEYSTYLFVDSMRQRLDEGNYSIPDGLGVSLIPCMNPDGCAKTPGERVGRFNSNGVDLNRNWGTLWAPTAIMMDGVTPVNPGTAPFSELENQFVKTYIDRTRPQLTVFYHCCIDPGFIFLNTTAVNSKVFQPYIDHSGFDVDYHDIILGGDSIEYLDEIGLNGVEVEFLRHQRTSPDIDFHLRMWDQVLASLSPKK